MIRGVVFDSTTLKSLSPVSIENISTHDGCFSNDNGEFALKASIGDYIVFTHVGYNRRVIRLKAMDNLDHMKIYMTTKTRTLKEVTIYKGLTEYQKDSVERAELYARVFDYKQQKSIFSPISSVYQKFSKKYKNLRKFQEQIIEDERQKFIDTRYKVDLVKELTKLEGDEVANFMKQYPMAYDYARAAGDVEVKMWIKYNFQDYLKKGRPAYVPVPKK